MAALRARSSEPELEVAGPRARPRRLDRRRLRRADRAPARCSTRLDTTTVATFDTDELLDHRARRPTMHLVEGVLAGLTWPSIELRAATDSDGNDMLLLVGAEPDHRWRAFTPRRRRPRPRASTRGWSSASAPTRRRSRTRGHRGWRRRRPSEELAALLRRAHDRRRPRRRAGRHRAPRRRGRPPGDRALGPGPALRLGDARAGRSAALLDGLARLAGLSIDRRSCTTAAAALPSPPRRARRRQPRARRRWSSSSRSSGTPRAAVAGLGLAGPIPSGDELAAEVERFLREQG